MANRTESGGPSAEARQQYGMRDSSGQSTGRFPIFDQKSALAALKLRGKAKDRKERRKIIMRAMEYAPDQAKAAMMQDKKDGMVD